MTLQLLHPYFLFALFVLAIPIIIHLFNFRTRKIIYFSDIHFLTALKTEDKAKSKIKNLLLLLTRILVITFLILAFTQPYIANNESKAQTSNTVGIYIDNSFSMQNKNNQGTLLNNAKNRALDLINAFSKDTRYILQTNDFEAKHQTPLTQKQAHQYITQIKSSPNYKTFSQIINRITDINSNTTSQNKPFYIFLLSDFQKNTTQLQNISHNPNIKLHLTPLQSQTVHNLYIDSLWFETPYRKTGEEERLNVKIRNTSNQSYQNIPLQLEINNQIKDIKTFNLEPHETQTLQLTYTEQTDGAKSGKVTITDYPITFDNTFYFSYTPNAPISLLIINDLQKNEYLNALFNKDPYITMHNTNRKNLNPHIFNNYHSIILNQIENYTPTLLKHLQEFIKNGGSVIHIPSSHNTQALSSYLQYFNIGTTTQIDTSTQFLSNKIDIQHPNFKNTLNAKSPNTQLPIIHLHHQIKINPASNTLTLLKTENQQPILTATPLRKGTLYTLATPIGIKYNNIHSHPIIIPTLYTPILNSYNTQPLYYTIGKNQPIQLPSAEQLNTQYTLQANSHNQSFTTTSTNQQINISPYIIATADCYTLYRNQQVIQFIAYNYDRKESSTQYLQTRDINTILTQNNLTNATIVKNNTSQKFRQNLTYINYGIPLWKYCIIASLLLLAVETLLLRKKRKTS